MLAALVFVALVAAALPWIASTQIVRGRIASELSAWTGYDVRLGAAPDIEIWPRFRAVLDNVALSQDGDASAPAVMQADRVEIELSALAALGGNVVFSKIRLLRPVLRVVEEDGRLTLPDARGGGRVAAAVRNAGRAVALDPDNPDFGALPADALGIVEFSEGRIVASAENGEREIVTSIEGTVNWPALNRSATVSAAGIWRGERVALDLSSPQPVPLLGGAETRLRASLASAPLTASLDGMVKLSQDMFDGQVGLSSPSLRRLLDWSQTGFGSDLTFGAVDFQSAVSSTPERIRFENAAFLLDGNPGSGVIDIGLGEEIPSLSGTLAFDALNLDLLLAFVSALVPLEDADGQADGPPAADSFNFDIRLSAARAMAANVTLTDFAATAQRRAGLTVFDISDATAFGGAIQAGIRIDRSNGRNDIETRLLASDVDGAALAEGTDLALILPAARGTISLGLKGPGQSWARMLEDASGSLAANFGPGTIAGLDLAGFVARWEEGDFFALRDVSGGSLAVERVEIKAEIERGVARLIKAEAQTPQQTVSLEGIIPYMGRGLALTGRIFGRPEQEGGESGPASSFFVGGSWNAPFVSPISARPSLD